MGRESGAGQTEDSSPNFHSIISGFLDKSSIAKGKWNMTCGAAAHDDQRSTSQWMQDRLVGESGRQPFSSDPIPVEPESVNANGPHSAGDGENQLSNGQLFRCRQSLKGFRDEQRERRVLRQSVRFLVLDKRLQPAKEFAGRAG